VRLGLRDQAVDERAELDEVDRRVLAQLGPCEREETSGEPRQPFRVPFDVREEAVALFRLVLRPGLQRLDGRRDSCERRPELVRRVAQELVHNAFLAVVRTDVLDEHQGRVVARSSHPADAQHSVVGERDLDRTHGRRELDEPARDRSKLGRRARGEVGAFPDRVRAEDRARAGVREHDAAVLVEGDDPGREAHHERVELRRFVLLLAADRGRDPQWIRPREGLERDDERLLRVERPQLERDAASGLEAAELSSQVAALVERHERGERHADQAAPIVAEQRRRSSVRLDDRPFVVEGEQAVVRRVEQAAQRARDARPPDPRLSRPTPPSSRSRRECRGRCLHRLEERVHVVQLARALLQRRR
jgi:hypothetical protein